ncbi:LOG family protein [Arthrobacter sp. M4]|uniref:LOG family protein n=1 Tax=Arthrobacter sp. M4 TaxID=218160 RepID=UPI001CDC523B|nr:Rossmann fold nucleotide-binding protein [Arthrobacter sp. M4]MCA4133862.1 Rossmann fold nucleotide-binding protein [Arthrobacter sp. M4]
MNPSGALNPSPRTLDVESVEHFDRLVGAGAWSMHGWHAQSLDLRGRTAQLNNLDAQGAIFLGCTFDDDAVEDSLRSRGALIFPKLRGIPFNPYRGSLYSAAELYTDIRAKEYESTPDARVYHWSMLPGQRTSLDATLAAALHDHAIGNALEELLGNGWAGARLVGVMGGHAAPRDSGDFAAAAWLGRLLALAGFTVATGGGPGSMEAANAGAYLSVLPETEFRSQLVELSAVPGFRPSVTAWARTAERVVERYPGGTESLGIPTWFYGHEPPNLFASHIAKYFANSVREAILLQLCNAGTVFLPGSAGTVQEIFQDACENYYGAPEKITPMVLVGKEHWQQRYPAWPMLQRLAEGRDMADRIFLVDSVEEALEVVAG